MNILIVDTDKYDVEITWKMFQRCVDKSEHNDWLVIPKGFDILEDVSVDWIKMIRDQLDEKIKKLESKSEE